MKVRSKLTWYPFHFVKAVLTTALIAGLAAAPGTAQSTASSAAARKKHAAAVTAARHGKSTAHSGRTHHPVRHKKSRRAPRTAKSIAKSRKLQHAFLASSQLRPMAQQLANNRTPAAYAGVLAFAHAHPGGRGGSCLSSARPRVPAGSELSGGHHQSRTGANAQGESLDDYADYLTAQAQIQSNQFASAETMLRGFAAKHPDSIFVGELPVTIANLAIQQGDPQTPLTELNAHASEAIANHADYLLALARAQQLAGNTDAAAKTFRHIYLGFPLSNEAAQAKLQLQTLGAQAPLTVAERRARADAFVRSAALW